MNARQKGFSTALMSLAVLAGALGAFTVVEFNAFVAKARVAEAFHVADAARLRVNEFYLLSDRFPSSEQEVEALTSAIELPSKHVREIVLEAAYGGHDMALKIYLDDAPVSGNTGSVPFVYVAADANEHGVRSIEWSCGAQGVAAELLPGGCVPVDG